MLIFGILGSILRRLNYPLAPLMVAMVLADGTKTALRQCLIMSDRSLGIFFTRAIVAPLMIAGLISFFLTSVALLLRGLRGLKS